MWVVKLGGSLAYGDELSRWLRALARTRSIIVPGGGPFADAVRSAQQHWHFPDQAAHDMAILAMQQYGRMLASMADGFELLRTINIPRHLPAIWLPDPEALTLSEIPASWDVTSDSLALWLADKIGMSRLLLVKAGWTVAGEQEIGLAEISAAGLCRAGKLDQAFAGYARQSCVDCWICGPSDHGHLDSALENPAGRFTRLQH